MGCVGCNTTIALSGSRATNTYFELTHRCRAQCSGPDKRLKPLDVPECMSSHLTTIHYKGFSEYEMELVEQILKEANVLKDNENHC